MSKNSLRTITIPAGIGDQLWLWSKLQNAGEKFNIRMPDGQPQRGHQVCELLPNLVSSFEYVPKLGYKKLSDGNIQNKKNEWKKINEKEFFLSANSWLESGKRIEGFLPDLPTSYTLDFATSEEDKMAVASLLSQKKHYIGIYTSAYSNARHQHYNGWGPDEWLQFCKLLYSQDQDVDFVIIGAKYDEDLAELLMAQLKASDIPFTNTIGEPLSMVVEILKRLKYFVGFPSGLSIINEMLGKDGVMFYGHKVAGLINTWADPERIKAGNIKECLFCDPARIFDWIKNDYQLFKKLL
ncbi:hypothetical protein [Paraflavitalea pollutisoli]|uniref:hypothetical protein n=1 Tax=Paraflavitalea pollutisoli TaxID=3034143 RepID=UPI0023EC947E|nr:hypothetical protein [Paraflavitalea sp. H1-2-19X]